MFTIEEHNALEKFLEDVKKIKKSDAKPKVKFQQISRAIPQKLKDKYQKNLSKKISSIKKNYVLATVTTKQQVFYYSKEKGVSKQVVANENILWELRQVKQRSSSYNQFREIVAKCYYNINGNIATYAYNLLLGDGELDPSRYLPNKKAKCSKQNGSVVGNNREYIGQMIGVSFTKSTDLEEIEDHKLGHSPMKHNRKEECNDQDAGDGGINTNAGGMNPADGGINTDARGMNTNTLAVNLHAHGGASFTPSTGQEAMPVARGNGGGELSPPTEHYLSQTCQRYFHKVASLNPFCKTDCILREKTCEIFFPNRTVRSSATKKLSERILHLLEEYTKAAPPIGFVNPNTCVRALCCPNSVAVSIRTCLSKEMWEQMVKVCAENSVKNSRGYVALRLLMDGFMNHALTNSTPKPDHYKLMNPFTIGMLAMKDDKTFAVSLSDLAGFILRNSQLEHKITPGEEQDVSEFYGALSTYLKEEIPALETKKYNYQVCEKCSSTCKIDETSMETEAIMLERTFFKNNNLFENCVFSGFLELKLEHRNESQPPKELSIVQKIFQLKLSDIENAINDGNRTLSMDYGQMCQKCEHKVTYRKSCIVAENEKDAPSYLAVDFRKAFQSDVEDILTGEDQKNYKWLSLPEMARDEYWVKDLFDEGKAMKLDNFQKQDGSLNNVSIEYMVTAVILTRIFPGMNGGHYVAMVKGSKTKIARTKKTPKKKRGTKYCWYLVDDDQVSEVDDEKLNNLQSGYLNIKDFGYTEEDDFYGISMIFFTKV